VRTINLSEAVGTIDVRLIPGDHFARAYTAGMIDGHLYLIDTQRGTARAVFDFNSIAAGGWPQLMRMTRDGKIRVLAYTGDYLEFPQSGFTVSDATLKNKRELIKRLLRGTLRGLQFTLKNRAETVRFIARDYKLQDTVAEKVYTSLLPAMSENGLATDKGLRVMVETLGTAVGKNVDFPPERLVDYTLLKEAQKELGM
jgi:ABC-type nitrate/sulfonate/bicarbonate transport system substrate-binding protein